LGELPLPKISLGLLKKKCVWIYGSVALFFALVLLSRWFYISILFGYDYVLFNIYQSCRSRPNDAFVHLSSGWELSGCTAFFDAFFLLIFYDTLIYLFTMGVKWLIDELFGNADVGSKICVFVFI